MCAKYFLRFPIHFLPPFYRLFKPPFYILFQVPTPVSVSAVIFLPKLGHFYPKPAFQVCVHNLSLLLESEWLCKLHITFESCRSRSSPSRCPLFTLWHLRIPSLSPGPLQVRVLQCTWLQHICQPPHVPLQISTSCRYSKASGRFKAG